MRYLSDEWLNEADRALRAAADPPTDTVTIDQHVEGAGSWRVVIGPTSSIARIESPETPAGEAAPADASFRQSLDTARAIATGATDSHQAFLLGDLIFEGDITRLIAGREMLEWLHRALEPVVQSTVWD